jgi:hypothetical protein
MFDETPARRITTQISPGMGRTTCPTFCKRSPPIAQNYHRPASSGWFDCQDRSSNHADRHVLRAPHHLQFRTQTVVL